VEPEGTVNLGLAYGIVRVADLTLEEAKAAIEKHLKQILKPAPQVMVALAQFRGSQQIRGEHLVHPDGTVHLGIYGNVYVADLTLAQAKATIEAHLTRFLSKPEIALDIGAYNSKVYYVITDGRRLRRAGGPSAHHRPRDCPRRHRQINGLPAVASKKHIWVARPAPSETCGEKNLPVDWCAITRGGSVATNYQLFAGDRIYVQADPLITTDTYLAGSSRPLSVSSASLCSVTPRSAT